MPIERQKQFHDFGHSSNMGRGADFLDVRFEAFLARVGFDVVGASGLASASEAADLPPLNETTFGERIRE